MSYNTMGALNLTAASGGPPGLQFDPGAYLERLQPPNSSSENTKRFSVSHLLQLDSLDPPATTTEGRDSDGEFFRVVGYAGGINLAMTPRRKQSGANTCLQQTSVSIIGRQQKKILNVLSVWSRAGDLFQIQGVLGGLMLAR